jgi:hypothetical protein
MGEYSISVVGESFRNSDGKSRQAEIKWCRVGEPVELVREPDNPHDANCVKVVSARGVQIGNIGRDNGWICERLDRGAPVSATIDFIEPADNGKLGVVLLVHTDGNGSQPKPEKRPFSQGAADAESMAGGCTCLVLIVIALGLVGWGLLS